MKFIKLSKTSWLILSAGLFVVILAGLGITRSQQLQEQSKLEDELGISQKTLDKIQVTDLRHQSDELQQKIEEGQLQLDDAKNKLNQTVVSVEVTDQFFSIAEYCNVIVTNMGTTPIQPNEYENVGLATTLLSLEAKGELPDLVNLVTSLNNDFTTGMVKSYQITIPPLSDNQTPTVNVQMIIYSYEGK
jgi:hypothetical protein